VLQCGRATSRAVAPAVLAPRNVGTVDEVPLYWNYEDSGGERGRLWAGLSVIFTRTAIGCPWADTTLPLIVAKPKFY
jgi:hypothetical protein